MVHGGLIPGHDLALSPTHCIASGVLPKLQDPLLSTMSSKNNVGSIPATLSLC